MSFQLHHTVLRPAGGVPSGWLLFLHGILGSGSNWRGVARRVIEARSEWGAVLVNLRVHGRSEGAPPPHSVAAAADDLSRLSARLASQGIMVRGVVGHSFGGKVALAWRDAAAAHRRGALAPLLETWVVDATPAAHPEALDHHEPGSSLDVVQRLRALPGQFSSRDEMVSLLEQGGMANDTAEWLAMNLEAAGAGFRMRLDLDAIHQLLVDYFQQDLWRAVEGSGLPGALHLMVGGRSRSVTPEEQARLAAAPGAHLHVVADAGHWVHRDAPDEVVRLLTAGLSAPPAMSD